MLLEMLPRTTAYLQCACDSEWPLCLFHYFLSIGQPSFSSKGLQRLNRYEALTSGTCISLLPNILLFMGSRGLDAAVQRLSESSKSSGVFTGKGQTLAGATTGPDLKSQANQTASKVTSRFNNIDPQVKVLLGLVVAYAAFWYITS